MSRRVLLARLAAAIAIVLVALNLFSFYREVHDARESIIMIDSLRRLAALTIRNFPERNLDSPDLFWKVINREGNPMVDAWNTVYQISSREVAGKKTYFWISAGPDRQFGTRDDIVVEVPYPDGPLTGPDLAPGESPVPLPVSIDAK